MCSIIEAPRSTAALVLVALTAAAGLLLDLMLTRGLGIGAFAALFPAVVLGALALPGRAAVVLVIALAGLRAWIAQAAAHERLELTVVGAAVFLAVALPFLQLIKQLDRRARAGQTRITMEAYARGCHVNPAVLVRHGAAALSVQRGWPVDCVSVEDAGARLAPAPAAFLAAEVLEVLAELRGRAPGRAWRIRIGDPAVLFRIRLIPERPRRPSGSLLPLLRGPRAEEFVEIRIPITRGENDNWASISPIFH